MANTQIHCLLVRTALGCSVLLAAGAASPSPQTAASGPRSAASVPDFVKTVQPVLRASCYPCHGAEKQEAGLRLDRRTAALAGGASGPVIVPGSSRRSRLYLRIIGQGGARMPLGFAPLPPAQIAAIRAWIDAGAQWPLAAAEPPKHWSYVKPVRPPLPPVKLASWVRNPIDRFVLARLEREGLRPAPRASRALLLRRVYLDLVGLPPSPAQVDAFLADHSPDAYERVVDGLLASPHFGERWARPWLDEARYADTNGYEKDQRRTIWPYRDWVINAFNSDMPYDRFTIEQIAGDLLPNATLQDRIATGFHRNTMLNEEGGVDQGEQRWLTIVDRVGTTASVWLGTTLACAQCHNHKYDPFTQKEYYQFFAFFDHCTEPELAVPTPDVQARRKALQDQITALRSAAMASGRPLDAASKKRLDDLQKQLDDAKDVTTLVMREISDGKTPSTYTHIKGGYLAPDQKVDAATPAVLNPFPPGAPRNRLGLARWIASPDNPLTARVVVNRLWELYFGRGLVQTSEDFGTQGEAPTHPKLLDWLATELIRRKWSLKAIHRLIVTSATFMQSSGVAPALEERDPYNRLLARGPRFRMEAEMIRDSALSAAGLLSLKVGGPSVFPPQPEGIWQMPYNGDTWQTSSGEDRYRRGIYTFWRRTSPYPSFVSFDAPSREACTLRRVRTDTPLQALTTLNDPAFFAAARGLARRMNAEPTIAAAITAGFRLCVARFPTARERTRLAALYQRELLRYAADPAAARALAALPADAPAPQVLAAWTVVGNVLLNMDETLTIE